jgi:hypothetical protein
LYSTSKGGNKNILFDILHLYLCPKALDKELVLDRVSFDTKSFKWKYVAYKERPTRASQTLRGKGFRKPQILT